MRFRRKLRTFTKSGTLSTSLRGFQSLSDRPGDATPSLGFHSELFPSRVGQAIVFRAAVVLGVSPKGGNPTFFFHSVYSGKERSWLNNKSAACNLLDSAPDRVGIRVAHGDIGRLKERSYEIDCFNHVVFGDPPGCTPLNADVSIEITEFRLHRL